MVGSGGMRSRPAAGSLQNGGHFEAANCSVQVESRDIRGGVLGGAGWSRRLRETAAHSPGRCAVEIIPQLRRAFAVGELHMQKKGVLQVSGYASSLFSGSFS